MGNKKVTIMLPRTWIAVAVMLTALLSPLPARAQENPNPEQVRKMYDDAMLQLKGAQDRKNQLADENEKLKATAEDLRKQLAAANARIEDLKRAEGEHAERTFFLRAHYAAWQTFIRQYPELLTRWQTYFEADSFATPRSPTDALSNDWPTFLEG